MTICPYSTPTKHQQNHNKTNGRIIREKKTDTPADDMIQRVIVPLRP